MMKLRIGTFLPRLSIFASCSFLLLRTVLMLEDPLDLEQCNIQGECPTPSFLPPTTAESYNECLLKCQAAAAGGLQCHWFTFYPEEQVCMLMTDCPGGPTAECDGGEPCFSGHVECNECDREGLWCQDAAVDFWTHVDSLDECKAHCSETSLCEWYNFDTSTNTCSLTSTCDVNTTTCATCTAGQRECIISDTQPEMNILMVIGGLPDGTAVEVIDLSGKLLTCAQQTQTNQSPDATAVGYFINGRSVLCAGVNSTDTCHTYDNETETWALVEGLQLKYDFGVRGGVVLVGDSRVWLTGGSGAGNQERTETEILSFSKVRSGEITSEPFTPLPRAALWHSILPLNESAVAFVGGYGWHDDAWLFSLDTNEWTQLQNMPSKRSCPLAGLATFPDGSRQLVITGGEYHATSTDIFNFETNTWRHSSTAGDLPHQIYCGSTVQFKDTFLIVGGRDSDDQDGFSNKILEFDAMNEQWIERQEHLSQLGKYGATAVLVPEDYIKCG